MSIVKNPAAKSGYAVTQGNKITKKEIENLVAMGHVVSIKKIKGEVHVDGFKRYKF